jgi:ATP-dependent DNA helicase RecG
MRPKDKERTMLAFVKGELHLLVSTVIVEVGLDVSNATIMVIEHPERFGLAQLHQLRGRIGRGEHPATCVVVSDVQEEAAEPHPAKRGGTSKPTSQVGRHPAHANDLSPTPTRFASQSEAVGVVPGGMGARLRAFVDTTDGFQLAEKDLALRGPGEFFGRRQHGWSRFRVADLSRDRAALEAARDEARALISRDPTLRDPAMRALRERLLR